MTAPPASATTATPAGGKGAFRARLGRVTEALSRQRHLLAVRDGILAALPLILIASIFLLVAQPPHPTLARWVEPYVGLLVVPKKMLTGLIAIYVCFGTAHALAKGYGMDPLAAGVVAAATFLTALTPVHLPTEVSSVAGWGVTADRLGSEGLFGAMLLAIVSVELTRVFVARNWTIRLPRSVPEAVYRSFHSLVPALVCITGIWLVVHVAGVDVVGLVAKLAAPLVRAGNTLPLVWAVVLVDSGLWLLGIHGMSALAVLKPVWLAMFLANSEAAGLGQPLPNVATQEFFIWFVWQGGSGGTLALALVMLARARSATLRSVSKLAVVPSTFNINEPLLFGTPVVLNPRLAVPFVVAPLLTATLTWAAMTFDLVARPRAQILWTLPSPVGAFLCTGGDWRAVVLQMVNLVVSALVYLPFLRRYDAFLVNREREAPTTPQ